MSVFDVGSLQSARLQNSASAVAAALVPKQAAKTSTVHADATAGSSGAATGSTTTGANITGNDFLVLLVSELKNQDPTQPTDPNAYISQLVGVNSLQQLISINQGITTIATPPTTTPPTTPPASGSSVNGLQAQDAKATQPAS